MPHLELNITDALAEKEIPYTPNQENPDQNAINQAIVQAIVPRCKELALQFEMADLLVTVKDKGVKPFFKKKSEFFYD